MILICFGNRKKLENVYARHDNCNCTVTYVASKDKNDSKKSNFSKENEKEIDDTNLTREE